MFWFLWSSGLCQGSKALWRDRNIMNASSAKWHRCKNSLYQLREHQCFPLTLQGKFDCVKKKRTETSMLLFLFLKISPPRTKALETSLSDCWDLFISSLTSTSFPYTAGLLGKWCLWPCNSAATESCSLGKQWDMVGIKLAQGNHSTTAFVRS